MITRGERETNITQAVLALALGRPIPELSANSWQSVFAAADRERLAAVIWARSGFIIRERAPSGLVESWRRRALHISTSGARQIARLRDALDALRSRTISAVVLKGPPLAQRIYGDATLRPSADFDIFIRRAERAPAREALFLRGWRSISGEPPHEEMFERLDGAAHSLLEIHSAPLDDPMLAHLRFPIEFDREIVGGTPMVAHTGDYLPAYLAAHLSKHESIPLLWIVDLHTVWSVSSDESRRAALVAGRRAGLERHLLWALKLVKAAEDAAAGSPAAIERVEKHTRRISELARLVRLMGLSSTAPSALRVLAGRVWPPEWRGGLHTVPTRLSRRALGALYRSLDFDRSNDPVRSQQFQAAITLETADAEKVITRSLEAGIPFWVRSRAASMHPAVPSSAAARITPFREGVVSRGDIVLACLPHGELVLQRVSAVDGINVRLKADAAERVTTVTQRGVLGLCDGIAVGGRIWPCRERPRTALDLLRWPIFVARSRRHVNTRERHQHRA